MVLLFNNITSTIFLYHWTYSGSVSTRPKADTWVPGSELPVSSQVSRGHIQNLQKQQKSVNKKFHHPPAKLTWPWISEVKMGLNVVIHETSSTG
jgi:hypothetical protein